MKSHFVLRLKNKLNQFGIFFIGCSNREIKQLEDYARFPLPVVYKEFIANFGKGTGNYLNDINIFYNDVFENKNSAEELLQEDKSEFNLKETDFVFCSYLGSQFMYFSLLEGNDPPVYYYSEGEDVPSKKFDSLSDCLLTFFEDVLGKI
jgi:hypothetical protein